jgi:hypothetical protein
MTNEEKEETPKPVKAAKAVTKVAKETKGYGAKITNNHKSDLSLPKGLFIRKGEVIEVSAETWKHLSNHDVVKSWINAKVISVKTSDSVETAEEDL